MLHLLAAFIVLRRVAHDMLLSNCTYTFSPLTGLIVHHNIDSIEPAPHQALFEALGKFGLLSGSGGGKAGGVGQ